MHSTPDNLFVYEIQQDGQTVHYLSPVPNEYGFKHGLEPHAIMGQFFDGGDELTPEKFARNSVFVEFLHKTLATYGPQCPGLIAEAQRIGSGSVAIIDLRVPDPNAAIEPEDVVAIFAVSDGQVGEYHPCPMHQIFNQHGFMKLDGWLYDRLFAELTPSA